MFTPCARDFYRIYLVSMTKTLVFYNVHKLVALRFKTTGLCTVRDFYRIVQFGMKSEYHKRAVFSIR